MNAGKPNPRVRILTAERRYLLKGGELEHVRVMGVDTQCRNKAHEHIESRVSDLEVKTLLRCKSSEMNCRAEDISSRFLSTSESRMVVRQGDEGGRLSINYVNRRPEKAVPDKAKGKRLNRLMAFSRWPMSIEGSLEPS